MKFLLTYRFFIHEDDDYVSNAPENGVFGKSCEMTV